MCYSRIAVYAEHAPAYRPLRVMLLLVAPKHKQVLFGWFVLASCPSPSTSTTVSLESVKRVPGTFSPGNWTLNESTKFHIVFLFKPRNKRQLLHFIKQKKKQILTKKYKIEIHLPTPW